jgi:hypothetical protein
MAVAEYVSRVRAVDDRAIDMSANRVKGPHVVCAKTLTSSQAICSLGSEHDEARFAAEIEGIARRLW